MKYKFLPVLAVLALLLGCIGPTPQPPAANNTVVAFGDTATADYTLRIGGEVKDTSNATLAAESNISIPGRTYGPIKFTVLHGQGLIRGFVNGVIGMKAGETKTFNVTPTDGYGAYDWSLRTNLSRTYNMSLHEKVPRSYFEAQNISLWEGRVLTTPQGWIALENVTNDTIDVTYLLKPGENLTVNGFPQTVLSAANGTAVIIFNVQENSTYVVQDPTTGGPAYARVTDVGNDSFIMDLNHEFAGKNLEFTVTLRSLQKLQPA